VRGEMKKTPFSFPNPLRGARILDGWEEGVFSWITVNYLTGNFGQVIVGVWIFRYEKMLVGKYFIFVTLHVAIFMNYDCPGRNHVLGSINNTICYFILFPSCTNASLKCLSRLSEL